MAGGSAFGDDRRGLLVLRIAVAERGPSEKQKKEKSRMKHLKHLFVHLPKEHDGQNRFADILT